MTLKKTQAKQIEELQARLAQQERQLAQQKQVITKYKEAEKTREFEKANRIPCPPGQAGRGDGYNLLEEMGVSKDTYHALRTVVRHKTSQYLDITTSLRKQDKSRIRTARIQIGNELPFIRKYYQALWPIHPIMKQYLASSSKAYRKAKGYLKDLEELPAPFTEKSANPGPGATSAKLKKSSHRLTADSSDEGNDFEDDPSGSSSSEDDDDEWAKDLERIEEDMQQTQIVANKGALTSNLKATTGSRDTSKMPGPSKRKGGGQHVAKTDAGNSKTRKEILDSTTQEQQNGAVQEGSDKPGPSSKAPTKPVPQTEHKGKYPMNCPNYDVCEDKFPENPSEQVKQLYQHCQKLRRDPAAPRYHGNGEPKGLQMQLALLCNAISADHLRNTAKTKQQWPTDIDFTGLHERILRRRDEIWSLLANDIVLHAAVVWQSFLDQIASEMTSKRINGKTVSKGLTFLQWSHMSPIKKFDLSEGSAGYFGPAGEQIILTTLQHHIYSPYTDASEALSVTIADIMETHGNSPTPDFWKGSKVMTLSLLDFMCYVAVPHVANLLIAVDYSVTESEANKMRLESQEHGKALYGTTGEIDDIAMRIAAPKRKPSPLSNVSIANDAAVEDGDSAQIQAVDLLTPVPTVPAQIARKGLTKKRACDNKENVDRNLLDLSEQPARKRTKMLKPAEELRRSLRYKNSKIQ